MDQANQSPFLLRKEEWYQDVYERDIGERGKTSSSESENSKKNLIYLTKEDLYRFF